MPTQYIFYNPGYIPSVAGLFANEVVSVDPVTNTVLSRTPMATSPATLAYTQTLPFNVANYGARGNGVADDTTAIQAAINAAGSAGGGTVFLSSGTYKVSSPLNLNSSGIVLVGVGSATILQLAAAGWSGGNAVNITADFCGIRDCVIAGASTTYSSNPATDAIQVTGARSCTFFNVYLNYINGWALQSSATAGIANYWLQGINIHGFQCKQGIHVLGVSGSSFNMAHALTNCIMDQIQNGDAYFIEDAHDVLISNAEGSVSAGTGNTLHIKGACAAIYISNGDLGPAPGPSTGSTMLIESGSNGTPRQISLNGGILEGGSAGATISAGNYVHFSGCDFYNNGTYGANISGGDGISFDNCSFYNNGSAGSSGRYDVQSSTTGRVELANCIFATPQGAGAQQTNNVINATAGSVAVENCKFIGTGYNSGNVFNGFPAIIRNCVGYNPLGNITVSVPSSGTDFATKSSDLTYFVTGGTVSSIKIGGVATGLTSGTFRVPAQQTFNITYSVAPSVTAFSD